MRITLLILLLTQGLSLLAGGFQVNLLSTKQIGMAHVGQGYAFDASSIYFNPGHLVFLKERTSFTGGINFIKGKAYYYNPNTEEEYSTKDGISTPFSFYAQTKVNKRLAVGLGIFTPYGSSLSWEDGWTGRYLITEISLRSFFFQPTFSYKLTENIGIGGGLTFATGDIYLEREVPITSDDGTTPKATLTGKDNAFSFVLGGYWQATEKLNIGVSYRHGMEFSVTDGYADFSNIPSEAQEFLPDQNFKGSLPIPNAYNFGIAYKASNKWLIMAEVNYTQWSVYKQLKIDFEEETDVLKDEVQPKKYSNTFTFRLGTSYQLNEKLTVRGGISRDNTPTNINFYSPETPDSDRWGFHIGTTVALSKSIEIDLAFMQVNGEQINTQYEPADFGGTFKGGASILSIGGNFKF